MKDHETAIVVNQDLARKWAQGEKTQKCLIENCVGNGYALWDKKICYKCFQASFDKKTKKSLAFEIANDAVYQVSLEVNALSDEDARRIQHRARFVLKNAKNPDLEHLARLLRDRLELSFAPVYEAVKKVAVQIEAKLESMETATDDLLQTKIIRMTDSENESGGKSNTSGVYEKFLALKESAAVYGFVAKRSHNVKYPEVVLTTEETAQAMKRFVERLVDGKASDFKVFIENSDPIPVLWLFENLGACGIVTCFGKKTREYYLPKIEAVLEELEWQKNLFTGTYENLGALARNRHDGRIAFSSKEYQLEMSILEGLIDILQSYAQKEFAA